MPTRLIIAYGLVLLMTGALAATFFVMTHHWRARRRMRRRGVRWRRQRRAGFARERQR